jgi:S1-C subfamily serine protease
MHAAKSALALFAMIALGFSPLKAIAAPVCHAVPLHLPREKDQALESLVIVQNGAELGSGVIISPDGYVLTAAHVVSPANKVAVFLRSGEARAGKVLYVNPKLDAALVKISARGLSCRPLMTELPPPGEPLYGIGLSLESYRATYQFTPGQLTGRPATSPHDELLQVDANLPIGNSGGPFLDKNGRIAGLIGWKSRKSASGEIAKDTCTYGASSVSILRMLRQASSNQLITRRGISKPVI